MENNTEVQLGEEFNTELRGCAKLLIEKLQQDDYEDASRMIENLAQARDRDIFQSVGKLTRALHDAIVNFRVEDVGETQPSVAEGSDFQAEGSDIRAEGSNIQAEGSDIQDASDGLNYVIDLTQKAADRTMDVVETAAPIAADLGREAAGLKQEWARLKHRDMNADEFRQLYQRMDDFFDQIGTGTEQLSKNLQDIILEQGFQDLTGQVLKRVIGLIRDVERELVGLVRIAGQVEDITGLADSADKPKAPAAVKSGPDIVAEGPQIRADSRDDVVSGQDDVDDLLSSLGF